MPKHSGLFQSINWWNVLLERPPCSSLLFLKVAIFVRVCRRADAGDGGLFLVASLTRHLAAPFKLTVAGGDNVDRLLPHVQPALFAHVDAFFHFCFLVGRVGVGSADPPHETLVAGSGVHPAVVGRRLQEHQLPLLHLLDGTTTGTTTCRRTKTRTTTRPGLTRLGRLTVTGGRRYPIGHEILQFVENSIVVVNPGGKKNNNYSPSLFLLI